MPRKEIDVTITAGTPETNRDYGKVFHITEKPALEAEKWATKALVALAQSGVEVPKNLIGGGMNSIAVLGIQALLNVKFEDAEPLLDDMMSCITIKETAITRKLTLDDIEEVATIFKLRGEVFALHTNFSLAGVLSKSTATTSAKAGSSDTPMSRTSSAQ